MFRRHSFGYMEDEEVSLTGVYGLMAREEGIRLSNDFHRLTIPSERNIDFKKIASDFSNFDVKENILTEQSSYTAL